MPRRIGGIASSSSGSSWAQIISFRNIVVHEYFGVDLELVWEIIDKEIDGLGSALQSILSAQGESPS